jgi:acetate kinase
VDGVTVRVLTVNAGSTSLKLTEVVDGVTDATYADLDAAFAAADPDAVAHRVVHGGGRTGAVVLDDGVLAELAALSEVAPLHQPPALAAIERCRRRWPGAPAVAAFDTAFHTTIPRAARTYALPAHLRDLVPARGFHGLSHSWAAAAVADVAPSAARLVVAHLGGGQSLCAVRGGRSTHTTMGFSPLDGLVMATRPGSVDPGALLWLARHVGGDLDRVLEQESGLVGLCGTGDMREVHRRIADGDDDASFAFDVWRHHLVAHLGACVALLGGIDALAFTGGIGEHDEIARTAATSALEWAGVAVTPSGTAVAEGVVEHTAPGAAVRTFVVASREDLQLAREAELLLAASR